MKANTVGYSVDCEFFRDVLNLNRLDTKLLTHFSLNAESFENIRYSCKNEIFDDTIL